VSDLWKDRIVNADRVPKSEWGRVIMWGGVIVLVTCLPYIIAWQAAPPGYQFGGILVNPSDGNSYLAKMRQGWTGAWQFHLSYTPEPHDGAFIFLFYLALGHIARLAHLPLVLVYHVARVVAGLVLLITTYAFLSRMTNDRRERWLAFSLVGTSAGLGWLGLAIGAFPIDLWVPEAFAFLSMLSNPHFPLAMALMLAVVAGAIWPAEGIWRWLVPGLAALLLAVIQPFALAGVYVTVAIYLLLHGWLERTWPVPGILAAVGVALFSVPVLLYDYRVYTTNPALVAWGAQNLTPSPRVLDLILGFGLVGLLAIIGGAMVVRQRDWGGLGLLIWGVGTLVLVYVPFALQRRMLTGVGLPLAILAAIGLNRFLLSKVAVRRARLVAILAVTFSLLGNLFLFAVLTLGVLSRDEQAYLFERLYLSHEEVAAANWLLTHAQDEVVLAAPRTGMLLPGRAAVRTFVGHPFETIESEAKEAQAESFFRGEMSDQEWQQLREVYQIHYLFMGPAERALGGGSESVRDLEPVFRQGEVVIHRLP
jgi:hypothetical protein